MTVQKFQVKVFLSNPEGLDIDKLIPVFHSWIRDKKLDELVIDVADYGHVHEGPGVVLIGHGSDYFVDLDQGRPGLLYNRKRQIEGDTEACLRDAVRRALRAASLLEKEDLGLRFSGDELLVRVNDRLNAPSSDATLATLRPAFDAVLGTVFGAGGYSLVREGDDRELFQVRVKSAESAPVASRLARLS